MKKWMFVGFFIITSIVSQAQSFPALRVVASHEILADVAQQVGGDFVTVSTLVRLDEDVRTHDITIDDIQTVEDADVLLLNGVGLEPFAQDLIPNVDTPYWIVSEGMSVLGERRGELLVSDAEVSLYMVLENLSNQDIYLITAEGDWFENAMTHATTLNGNMAQMQDMEEGILIPANGIAELQPASLHLMAMGVNENLVDGQTNTFTLRFSDGSELDVPFLATFEGIELGTNQNGNANNTIRVSDAWAYPLQVTADNPPNEGGYLGALLDDVNCGDNPNDSTNLADCNPFVWYDPQNVALWAENIALIFADYDPEHASDYETNAQNYITQLMALDTAIASQLEAIPFETRQLVLEEDFLAYFAMRYNVTIETGQANFVWEFPRNRDGSLVNYIEWMTANVLLLEAHWSS